MLLSWYWRWRRLRSRAIFLYFDGRWIRRADPIVIDRRLREDDQWSWIDDTRTIGTSIDGLPDDGGIGKEIEAAQQRIVKAVRRAFSLPSFEQGGLGEQECLALLATFEDWTEALKKNGGPHPTSPQSTGTKPHEMLEQAARDMRQSAGCTSTESDS